MWGCTFQPSPLQSSQAGSFWGCILRAFHTQGKNHMFFTLYLRSSHWSPGVVLLCLIHTSPVCSRNDCLAFVSKNCATNTQQLLCRISLIGNRKTSNIEISMLWVGLTKTLDAFLMRRRDWKFFLLWVMREMIMNKSRLLTPAQDNKHYPNGTNYE